MITVCQETVLKAPKTTNNFFLQRGIPKLSMGFVNLHPCGSVMSYCRCVERGRHHLPVYRQHPGGA